MHSNQSAARYDQGFFNTACSLVDEIASRSHLHFLCEMDASGMDRIRRRAKANGQIAPTYTAFVIKAAARALRQHPNMNMMIQERPWERRLVPLHTMTATVAVERMVDGIDMVMAPMMKQPDERTLGDLSQQLKHFAEVKIDDMPEYSRFRDMTRWARWIPTIIGKLFRLPSLSPVLWKKYRGGSFAVTSPGKYGGCDQVLPPWPWPLTFSFGNVKVRPFVVNGEVVPRKTMRLTITSDRRLANGAPLARFAECVRELLEAPESLDTAPVTKTVPQEVVVSPSPEFAGVGGAH